jgi:hypothetical protein
MFRSLAAIAGLVLFCGSSVVRMAYGSQKTAEGTAEGFLKVNGTQFSLKHAYAVADAPELAMPSMGKDGFDLFVTDKPLTDAELECRTIIMLRVRKGDLHGIVLSFNPAKKGPHNGQLWSGKQSQFFSILGEGGDHKFEGKSLTGNAIAGRVWTPKEQEGVTRGPEPLKFQYDATVQAKVRRPGPITATLTGKAAQMSPEAKALMAFCKAVRAGSRPGLQASGVKSQIDALSEPDRKELFKAMQQEMPDPAKLKVTKVVERGGMAVLQAKGPESVGQMSMKCLKEGGAWKISLN